MSKAKDLFNSGISIVLFEKPALPDGELGSKDPLVNLAIIQVFPTPESPTKTIVILI